MLVENDPDLREVEDVILSGAGFRVETPPPNVSPAVHAAQNPPRVIVIHLSADLGAGLELIDQLQANPTTREVPVVVIATEEEIAARARAGANVGVALVAPSDVTALTSAVVTALGHPPPAATLPSRGHPHRGSIAFATTALVQRSRDIVVQTVEGLRLVEPYRSRFSELSVELVNALGTLLGAITTGLQRGLPPAEVFAVPEVRRTIHEHVQTRRQQQLGPTVALRDVQALRNQIRIFLLELEGHSGFTLQDALDLSLEVQAYFDSVSQIIVTQNRPPNGRPFTGN